MPGTTIDMTPTWGEIGVLYTRLAESREVKAVREMRADVARAFAAAQALQAIRASLTEAQATMVAKTLTDELRKQGF